MKRGFVLLLLLLLFYLADAQQVVLTLDSCYQAARKTYPGIEQLARLEEAHQMSLKNIRAAFLPKSQLTATASYQSDVTSLGINLPMVSIPTLPKDSYKAYLDVTQLIFDGGANRARKQYEDVEHKVDNLQVEADFYKIKELVNDLVFAVETGRATLKQLEVGKSNLEARRKTVGSAVENGMLPQAQLETVTAEIAVQDQRITEVTYAVRSALGMLSVWLGRPLADDAGFDLHTGIPGEGTDQNIRPENQLFGLQYQLFDHLGKQTSARLFPVVSGYGQAGYGRPGLNMLNSDFDSWYMVGVRLQWNFFDWNQTANERSKLRIKQEISEIQHQAYDQRIKAQLEAVDSDIEKTAGLLKLDNLIIASREEIGKAATSQFENGTLDAADWVARTNEETQARINFEIHKLQLLQYQVKRLTILGQL